MLADLRPEICLGRIDPDIQFPSTAKLELLEFIAAELPSWRDLPSRPCAQAETLLTEQLSYYLSTATYASRQWSHIQFRTEAADEVRKGRTIDIAIKPLAATLIIEGRRHTIFDTILPIECKRLPTPSGADRDPREYVFSQHASTGGIQRFKCGLHGAAHNLGAMIGYVQEGTSDSWRNKVAEWIEALASSKQTGWTTKDLLQILRTDATRGVAVLVSSHVRERDLADIELRHLWIQMNKS